MVNFTNSNLLREKARKIIPLGAHTFTRSYTQFPFDHSPLFVTKGKGGRIWDVDNNEYVDLLSGLLSVVLGYCDVDVDAAIKEQLNNGITFSLSTEKEIELAELLIKIIPSAEMVRFGKSGSDSTSAAIRLSRHVTKRDKVAICGYHGWHDWYAGITNLNSGIPEGSRHLSMAFQYNDIDSLYTLFHQNPGEIAAVIMEPMNVEKPRENFLEAVQELANTNGALLIFDEVITGFRFDIGGAQSLFKVTPDLSVFGKAMANGMPLSALVGKEKYMNHLAEVFYSSTFAPETLSLVASIATIKKMQKENVVEQITMYSSNLKEIVSSIIEKNKLENVIALKGMDPWIIISFKDVDNISSAVIRTFFQKEMIASGVFILHSHNINYAHNNDDRIKIIQAYEHTFEKIAYHLNKKNILESLGVPSIKPVFTVRNY